MPKDFDWNNGDKESVVVPAVQAVAVYTNPAGDVVIRQESPMQDEDDIIVVPRQHAKALAKAITEAAKQGAYEPKTGDL